MSIVIKVENLSKAYQLGQFSTGTISQDIHRWWALLRGDEDPYLKIGEVNDRSKRSKNNIVWSLKDIEFNVNQGEAIGIIGKNGAGKSTLLKILSKVTSPTKGFIKIKGRIASLLEVGTGFHPELTGKENIFLNGAILGMRKNEINRKLDEIIDFSGVERYIDTPVKRYSSGMYVRLAFAVAAHLESEILIVDEVLAVGDAEFQKKCMWKMNDVNTKTGRTILFVSHNMTAVQNLCTKGILLNNGSLSWSGDVGTTINQYMNLNLNPPPPILYRKDRTGDGRIQFTNIEYFPNADIVKTGTDVIFRLHFNFTSGTILKNVAFSFSINTLTGNHLLVFSTNESNSNIQKLGGNKYIDCLVKNFPIASGTYSINLFCTVNGVISDYVINAKVINVDDSDYYLNGASKDPNHPVYVAKHQWLTH